MPIHRILPLVAWALATPALAINPALLSPGLKAVVGPAPVFGAFLGVATGANVAVNNALVTDTLSDVAPGHLPFAPPTVVTNSWGLTFKVQFDQAFSKGPLANGSTSYLWTCGDCSNGGPYLAVSSPNQSSPGISQELLFNIAGNGGSNGWFSPTSGLHTGITVRIGDKYCGLVSQYGGDAPGTAGVPGGPGTMSIALLDLTTGILQTVTSASGANNQVAANFATTSSFYYRSGPTLRSRLNTNPGAGQLLHSIGGYNSTAATNEHGLSGGYADFGMLYGVTPNTSGAPTLAGMQALCVNGAAAGRAWWLANATTGTAPVINAWYPLDASKATLADSGAGNAGSPWGNATFIDNAPVIAPPLAPIPGFALMDLGPGWVYPVATGQTGAGATGTIWVNAVVDPARLGVPIRGLDAEILQGATDAFSTAVPVLGGWKALTASTLAAGVYHYPFPVAATVGQHYFIAIRPHDSPTYVVYSSPSSVGLNIAALSISQFTEAMRPGATNNGGSGQTLVGQAGQAISYVYRAPTDGWYSGSGPAQNLGTKSVGYGQVGLVLVTPKTAPGGASNVIGDGFLSALQDLAVGTGWPVQLTLLADGGQFLENYTVGNVALTLSTSGGGKFVPSSGAAGTSFTATLAMANATTPIGTLISGAAIDQGQSEIVKPGSVQIFNGGGALIATDLQSSGVSSNVGTLVGQNGFVINTGAIDYRTGAITGLKFTAGAVAASPYATWIELRSTGANSGNRSAYPNFDEWGDGVNASSGYMTQTLAGLLSPPSLMLYHPLDESEAASYDGSDAGSGGGGLFLPSYIAKTKYIFQSVNRLAGQWWWKQPGGAGTPTVYVMNEGRDGGLNAPTLAGLRAASARLAPLPGFGALGSFYDYFTECPDVRCFSAHPTISAGGGPRWGHRLGQNILDVAKGATLAREPTITAAAFKGCPGACDYTRIEIPLAVTNGDRVATCDATLSRASPVCNVHDYLTPQAVGGFRIGLCAGGNCQTNATAILVDETGLDEASTLNGSYQAFDGLRFACALTAKLNVECTKTSGAWTSGSTYLQYASHALYDHAGSLLPPLPGVASGGTGYTNGTQTVAQTTGSCSANPYISFTVAGGAITALGRYSVGSCTVNPAVLTLPTTAGAVATFTGAPLYATETTDQNAMGGLLYDSTSCATACAASTTQPTVPGNPVTPVVTPILVTG